MRLGMVREVVLLQDLRLCSMYDKIFLCRKRDEIECRGLANGTKLECETENDGRYIECEFEQSRQFEIKFTCDVDIDCQIQCGESALSNIPTSYRGQVESILNAWVPYDD